MNKWNKFQLWNFVYALLKARVHYRRVVVWLNSNMCLWSVGVGRSYIKEQVNVIWKESVKKDFWSYERKRLYVENQNKRWTRWINPLNAELNPTCHLRALFGAHHIFHVSRIRVNKTYGYNNLHKSTKIKLVWPFTPNAGRENGKKVL